MLPLLKQEPAERKAPLDMSLFLKLQKRVTELEQEKQSLQDELDRKEEQALRIKAKVKTQMVLLQQIIMESSCGNSVAP